MKKGANVRSTTLVFFLFKKNQLEVKRKEKEGKNNDKRRQKLEIKLEEKWGNKKNERKKEIKKEKRGGIRNWQTILN